MVENELRKIKSFDLSYFIGKTHFEKDVTENYLVFQLIQRYLKVIANAKYISSWKSKRIKMKTLNILLHLIIVFLH